MPDLGEMVPIAVGAASFLIGRGVSSGENHIQREFTGMMVTMKKDGSDLMVYKPEPDPEEVKELNHDLAIRWGLIAVGCAAVKVFNEVAGLPYPLVNEIVNNIVEPIAVGMLACTIWDLTNALSPGIIVQGVKKGASLVGTIFNQRRPR